MSLERRRFIKAEIERLKKLTGIALVLLLTFAGIKRRTWNEWEKRKDEPTKHNNNIPRNNYLTPDEVQAIVGYCRDKTALKGYRVLCYEMIDLNIACVAEISVYRVIKRHNLLQKWQETSEPAKHGFDQPTAIHEHWHIDFSYVKIQGVFYYFIGILDGFSRRMLNWKLCENMEGLNAELLVTETKEIYSDAVNPRLISDNGGQFTSKDFVELLVLLEIGLTHTSANHPQSNGKLERYHRTWKEESVRVTAYTSYEDALARIGGWIYYYNSERLHSAIKYLTPDDVFFGRGERRLAERKEKLHTAFINRQAYWQNQASHSLNTPY